MASNPKAPSADEINAGSKATSTECVTVACKLPSGLLLQVFEMEEFDEPTPGGSRRTKRARLMDEHRIRGTAHRQEKAPGAPIFGGYALTPGVPKALWDRWISDNRDAPMVKNHLIFAHSSKNGIRDEAKDHKSVRSGLERINPKKLPGKLTMDDQIREHTEQVEQGLAQEAEMEEISSENY